MTKVIVHSHKNKADSQTGTAPLCQMFSLAKFFSVRENTSLDALLFNRWGRVSGRDLRVCLGIDASFGCPSSKGPSLLKRSSPSLLLSTNCPFKKGKQKGKGALTPFFFWRAFSDLSCDLPLVSLPAERQPSAASISAMGRGWGAGWLH